MSKKLAIAMFGQKRLSREGGVEIVVKELCTRMAQNGCDVTCYNRAGHHVSGAEYDDAGKTEYEGIRQKSVPTIERRGLAAVSSSAFAALYSAFGKYDVVHIHARTGMEYVLVGDYYLPALKLPRTRPIGRWGMLHKAYLKLRKPAYYQSLLLSGKLDTVLANVEEQAVERYEVLIEQLSQRESVSEKLKEENQMEWVRRMRNLENRAAEIVKAELIYTFERR
ncbi:MAG: TnpV protein [Faecalibacterium sp.]|uniref:TnpV protein n=1 Tax=Faecalibacterium sp. TaxID=1971605 RepID=UPI0039999BA2